MLYEIFSLLLQVITALIAGTCLLRMYIQLCGVNMSLRSGIPIAPFVFALTNWLVHPLRRVVPSVGRLDSASSPDFEAQVLETLQSAPPRLVLDMSALDYVSSAGLRVILLAGKRLKAGGGRLALAGLRDNVRDVFEMSGFLTLFPILPTVDEALADA